MLRAWDVSVGTKIGQLSTDSLTVAAVASSDNGVIAVAGAKPREKSGEVDKPASETRVRLWRVKRRPEVFLSDLLPEKVLTFGPKTVLDQGVVVNGKPSPHGVWSLPFAGSRGFVRYNIAQQFERFRGAVAVNDSSRPEGPETPVVFRILGDGKVLWKSNPLPGRGDSQEFDVDVSNVSSMEIDATSGEARWSEAVWVEPRLSTKPSPEMAPPSASRP